MAKTSRRGERDDTAPKRRRYLRCFVAMILRKDSDADLLYQKRIKPALRRIGIRAFRIDEIEHSENIDERILTEISGSDLLLADLTYARPSVYFEAGFAMSKELKVLLTCRSDHFSPKSDSDPCVHFDINHRKIIEWSNPNDKTFSKRLESHARALSRPLFERAKRDDEERRRETEFARLPVKQRLNSLFQEGVKMLRASKFEAEHGLTKSKEGKQVENLVWSGSRRSKEQIQAATLQTLERYSLRKEGSEILKFLLVSTADKLATGLPVSAHVIMPLLKAVPLAKLESQFADFVPSKTGGAITLTHLLRDVGGPRKQLFVHVMPHLRSIAEFRERMQAVIEDLDGSR